MGERDHDEKEKKKVHLDQFYSNQESSKAGRRRVTAGRAAAVSESALIVSHLRIVKNVCV